MHNYDMPVGFENFEYKEELLPKDGQSNLCSSRKNLGIDINLIKRDLVFDNSGIQCLTSRRLNID